jgi:hypothetical protein
MIHLDLRSSLPHPPRPIRLLTWSVRAPSCLSMRLTLALPRAAALSASVAGLGSSAASPASGLAPWPPPSAPSASLAASAAAARVPFRVERAPPAWAKAAGSGSWPIRRSAWLDTRRSPTTAAALGAGRELGGTQAGEDMRRGKRQRWSGSQAMEAGRAADSALSEGARTGVGRCVGVSA